MYKRQVNTALTSVIIPDSVTSIGSDAFDASVAIWMDSITCADIDVNGLLTIPDGVTSMSNAFGSCSQLTSVSIPNSVETIGQDVFQGTALTVVTMNANISFDKDTFGGCASLTTLVIGNSVETIGGEAFKGCSQLDSIIIGDSVKTIENGAF